MDVLQPIKNDESQLDFYTTYKRETAEYNIEHMQKYSKDLNTTLISMRFRCTVLTTLLGWSVLCGQLCLRRRRPAKARAKLQRTVGNRTTRF